MFRCANNIASAKSQKPKAKSPRHGFTLIELLVVIGIIVLLAGLTVSVSTAVVQRAEAQQTRQTLQLLDMAVHEWEQSADRKLTWWSLADPPGEWDSAHVHADTEDILIISEILQVISRNDSVKSMLTRIDDQFIYTYEQGTYPDWIDTTEEQSQMDERFDGAITVLDAWGTPIYATHPGRKWQPGDYENYQIQNDPDGTIRTYNEQVYGLTKNQSVCFVSAGPDGQFGDLAPSASSQARALAQDNLFSYEPVIPE